mgnify:CR=1 FL=1|tara:strand:- start:581 stop:1030 length:450 start_codon:yes stop_codon:yes gene_type:complete
MSDLRSKVIKLAHTKPELRQHLIPLLKKAGEFQYGVAEVKYRIENPNSPVSQLMVMVSFDIHSSQVNASGLIKDLQAFEKKCKMAFDMLDGGFKNRGWGHLKSKDQFIRGKLAKNTFFSQTAYYSIDEGADLEEITMALEKYYGAKAIR